MTRLPFAEQGEEERQLEDLQAARDERRQLLDVAAEVELDDPHAVAADAVDLQPLHHAVEDLQVLRVERAGAEARTAARSPPWASSQRTASKSRGPVVA